MHYLCRKTERESELKLFLSLALATIWQDFALNKPDYSWIMMEFMEHNVESGQHCWFKIVLAIVDHWQLFAD